MANIENLLPETLNCCEDLQIFGDDTSKVKIFAFSLDGIITDVAFCEYSDKQLIIVTQFQKIGTLISVTKNCIRNLNGISDIYDIKTICGLDNQDYHLVIRYLAEQLNIIKPVLFGICLKDVVIGPPGCGKTTYCRAMQELLKELGRKVAIVNIDPANEFRKYSPDINMFELITLEDAMENMKLGPNGALMYCMEFLEKNLCWLDRKISNFKGYYFLFDCPGQVELYTHHSSVKNILHHLEKSLNISLCVVQLIDSHYCSDPGKFIATVLMALSSMLQLEMPQINILSKIDLANKYVDKLQFGLDFYTEVLNLNYFIDGLDENPITKKYSRLNEAIISLVENYSLVSFIPLDIKNKKSLLKVRAEADKANGYVFGAGEERNVEALLACAVGVEYENETLHLFGEKPEMFRSKDTNLSEDLLWK